MSSNEKTTNIINIVEEKEYFHIQRSNIPKPWKPEQTFFFGNDLNYFFGYYNNHHSGRKDRDGKSYPALYLVKHVINVINGNINKNSKIEENFGYDPLKTLEIAKDALKDYTMLVRELTFEEVRLKHFPHCPSRMRCIWVIPTNEPESLKFWNTIKKGPILKLSLTGKVLRTNEEYLKNDTFSLNKYRMNAFKYWAGIKGQTSAKDEVLLEGFIKVLEVFKDIKDL